jgi:hypothetical protein
LHTRLQAAFFSWTSNAVQLYFDDLPIWGFVGKVEKYLKSNQLRYFLFTHFHFDVLYNGDRIIGINTSADPQRTVDITEDAELLVEFSYSVKWQPTTTQAWTLFLFHDVPLINHFRSLRWYRYVEVYLIFFISEGMSITAMM